MKTSTLFASLALPIFVACSSSTNELAPKDGAAPANQAAPKKEAAPNVAPAPKSDAASKPDGATKIEAAAKSEATTEMTLHKLKVDSLDTGPVDLSKYKGDVVLVVNVASECGYTPQYAGLEELEQQLSSKGFHVLGFPSNEFGGQEPGAAEQIRKFCTEKYSVTFPLFAKSVTKAGPDQAPIFTYLGNATGKLPTWNFCKYLVGRDGKAIAFYPSKVKPDDEGLRAEIDKALAAAR